MGYLHMGHRRAAKTLGLTQEELQPHPKASTTLMHLQAVVMGVRNNLGEKDPGCIAATDPGIVGELGLGIAHVPDLGKALVGIVDMGRFGIVGDIDRSPAGTVGIEDNHHDLLDIVAPVPDTAAAVVVAVGYIAGFPSLPLNHSPSRAHPQRSSQFLPFLQMPVLQSYLRQV
jgi:hypothetical protein